MKELLAIMAGNQKDMIQKPAHAFTVNISSPLAWSEVGARNLIRASQDGFPLKFVSIPIAGGTSPVTLAGTLTQLTAENLSAVVISQVTHPGNPILWGGTPSILEMRHGTTPMTSPEAVVMNCANTQIGRHFGIPTASHGGRADSKRVDSQSGMEAALAISWSAMAGTNVVGGPGFLEYASTQSLEKLLIDNELCGQVRRMIRGVEVTDDTQATDLIKEISQTTEGFMSSRHTLQSFKNEFHFASDIIDVGSRSRYEATGARDVRARAHEMISKMRSGLKPLPIDENRRMELIHVVKSHAKPYGLTRLPIEDGYA